MSPLLHALLADPVSARKFDSLTDFRAAWATPVPRGHFDAAVLGGLLADRLGYAFAAGYASALRCLVPSLGPDIFACLCVTEDGGAHPRAIQTTLSLDRTLTGQKRWTTLAADGELLLVAAREPASQGGSLRLATVRRGAPGLELTSMPPTPFAPEIPHFTVTFTGTPTESVLPGDGWNNYVKPFRTVEDIHVCGAALGYLVHVARTESFPPSLIARLVVLVVALRAVADLPPDDPGAHIALGGIFDGLNAAISDCGPHWDRADAAVAGRWARDAPLLQVASEARVARLAKAWERVGAAR